MNGTRHGRQRRPMPITVLLSALLLLGLYTSLFIGKFKLTPAEVHDILLGGGAGLKREVFWTLRLPRSFMAVLAGAGLGLAGCVYQIIFKNPLATPDIIGVSSGANLGTAVAIVLLGYNMAGISVLSFAGALSTALFVILLVRLAGRDGNSGFILAGIAARATADSLIMLLKVYADPERELAALEYWSMGSLKNITHEKLLSVCPFFFAGMIGLILLRRQITLLGLEEEEAKSLGLPVGPVRLLVIGCATLIVASVISVTGLIAFIGLLAPHIARLILKRNGFFTAILSGLIGALVLLTADCVSRLSENAELPISIYTSLVGVPLLIYYMVKRRRQ